MCDTGPTLQALDVEVVVCVIVPGKTTAAKASLPNPHTTCIQLALNLRHKVRRLDRFTGLGLQWHPYYALVKAERKLRR